VAEAEAAVSSAELNVGNATIVAPFAGIIRNVIAQPGMVVSPNVPVLSIINNGVLKMDAYVSETDVAKVQSGQNVEVTLDAYGDGAQFPAQVTAVDTAETTFNGSPAYHVTLYFTQPDSRIRSGMTGNVLITASEKNNVVEVPSRLVLDDGGNNFVLVPGNGRPVRRQITTGLTGDNGMVEVTSGLSAGDKINDF
jgi:HlyD family secretion protein